MAFDVAVEVGVDEAVEALFTGEGDAELVAYGAVGAVGGHDRVAGECVGLSGLNDPHGHSGFGVALAGSCRDGGDLVAETHIDQPGGDRGVAQYGFEEILRRHDR